MAGKREDYSIEALRQKAVKAYGGPIPEFIDNRLKEMAASIAEGRRDLAQALSDCERDVASGAWLEHEEDEEEAHPDKRTREELIEDIKWLTGASVSAEAARRNRRRQRIEFITSPLGFGFTLLLLGLLVYCGIQYLTRIR